MPNRDMCDLHCFCIQDQYQGNSGSSPVSPRRLYYALDVQITSWGCFFAWEYTALNNRVTVAIVGWKVNCFIGQVGILQIPEHTDPNLQLTVLLSSLSHFLWELQMLKEKPKPKQASKQFPLVLLESICMLQFNQALPWSLMARQSMG